MSGLRSSYMSMFRIEDVDRVETVEELRKVLHEAEYVYEVMKRDLEWLRKLIDGIDTTSSTDLTGALLVVNNLSDVASASASRTNLGLGSMATLDYTGVSQNVTFNTSKNLIFNSVTADDFFTIRTDSGDTLTFRYWDDSLSTTSSPLTIRADIVGVTDFAISGELRGGSVASSSAFLDLSSGTHLRWLGAGATDYTISYSGSAFQFEKDGNTGGSVLYMEFLDTGRIEMEQPVKFNDDVGFFATNPVAKTSVTDMGALATTETANGTYDTTEQDMLNNLKTDVTSLRTKLNELLDALQGYGLV